MKKIFLLMTIMTSLFFALSIDSNATSIYGTPGYDYYDNLTLDTPIDELSGNSLKTIFEDYNEVLNYNLNDTSSYISVNNTYFNVNNNVGSFLPYTQYGRIQQDITTYQNDYYYGAISVKTDKSTVGIDPQSSGFRVLHSGSGNWERLSFYFQAPTTGNYGVRIIELDTSNFTEIQFKVLYYINATYHDIEGLTKGQLDYFYTLYTILSLGLNPQLIYDIGYTHGFTAGTDFGYDTGYDTGYDAGLIDGYNNGYSDGYDNGYSDGQEDGYDTGYLDGNVAGLETGYNNGYNDGYSDGVVEEVDTQWLLGFVTGTVNVLGVSIIPGISLGVFVFIPLFLGFIGFIFRLGGRRG